MPLHREAMKDCFTGLMTQDKDVIERELHKLFQVIEQYGQFFLMYFDLQYGQRHSVINLCDGCIILLSDTDISFAMFKLFTYFLVHFS